MDFNIGDNGTIRGVDFVKPHTDCLSSHTIAYESDINEVGLSKPQSETIVTK